MMTDQRHPASEPAAEPERDQDGRPVMDAETLAFAQRVIGQARVGAIEPLAAFLDKGLPPNLCNDKGDSLLMLAAYHGHTDLVRLLLQHGADAELANDRGQTPLAAAAFKGDLPTVEALLDGGAQVDGSGPDGRTALITAAMFDRVAIVELLLARGADRERRDGSGLTAREAAEKMGAQEVLRLLS